MSFQLCRNNTSGQRCERCAEGFYGDPDITGCQSCPCPETNKNFARGCTFHNNRVSCICRRGYTGDLCDQCARGFFGPDIIDGHCTECDCDPNGIVSNECDEANGQCNCKSGVTGRRCDRCEDGRSILQNGNCNGGYHMGWKSSAQTLKHYHSFRMRQLHANAAGEHP